MNVVHLLTTAHIGYVVLTLHGRCRSVPRVCLEQPTKRLLCRAEFLRLWNPPTCTDVTKYHASSRRGNSFIFNELRGFALILPNGCRGGDRALHLYTFFTVSPVHDLRARAFDIFRNCHGRQELLSRALPVVPETLRRHTQFPSVRAVQPGVC